MPLQTAAEWAPHIEEMVSTPGIIMVIGAVDTGKTSFCTLLANRTHEAGTPTAAVDTDMGQSEIGPPTTLGMGLLQSSIRSLSDIHPRGLYFVGATSPVGYIPDALTGTAALAERARELGAEQVVVDTTGLVKGVIARQLKTHKIELLRPRHIVALQKSGEAEHFLRFFDVWKDCTVHRLPVSPQVHPRSQTMRTQRRSAKFAEYFREAQAVDLRLDDLATSNTYLGTGRQMEPKYATSVSRALRTDVLHGEFIGGTPRRPGGLYLITASDYNKQGVEELKQEFGTSAIAVVPAARYANLVVGLIDDRLHTLAIGIIRRIDFRAMVVSIVTPLRSLQLVRAIRLGSLKLRPDGAEIARLRPGEV